MLSSQGRHSFWLLRSSTSQWLVPTTMPISSAGRPFSGSPLTWVTCIAGQTRLP
ncbi:hypothetical protein JOD57_003762 [Geodermatophilus bullaregiensis]|nr:hypothetical protein [Geodermatophilus bullaregiensis]MBM7807925.1 hypothetical protein [Geodermatophilus bullaregiensis]